MGKMTKPLYYSYWGKADNPLKVAYCSGNDKETIFSCFKKQIASRLRKTESALQLEDLDVLAKKEKWQYKQPNYASYHLLPFHCLDVAAVGYFLLAPETDRCKQLAGQLEVSPQWLRDFFVFCLSLHDLGKFSRAFQGLQKYLSEDLVKPYVRMSYDKRHDSLGFCLWIDQLRKNLSEKIPDSCLKQMESWLEIVTGHHGQPPLKKIAHLPNYFLPEDTGAALQFVQDAVDFLLNDFDFRPLQDKALKKRLKTVSWQLAGIAVLADWLGSNQDYFDYSNQPKSLNKYWQEKALPGANKAIQNLPEQPKIQAFSGIQELFDFIDQPTPLQQFATEVELNLSPQLFILEDVTGAGKTEAALVLAQRLMTQDLAKGLYIALPTMATANAMYERLGQVYRKFFQIETNPSLILAHGARNVSESFRQSTLLREQPNKDSDYLKGKGEEELTATAYCNAWLADSRKKALLADVGVGTLDQALLAVLPARHQSLRLLGLNGKILLVDEVHAYDSYMQKLLNALLEAHAQQGGSVILLSATLPWKMRSELVAAFYRGLDTEVPELKCKKEYPLVTHTPAAKDIEKPLDTREQVKRTVQIHPLATEAAVLKRIQQSIQNGLCVCWIRNTVKEARKSYQDCLDGGLDANRTSLFHSRFAMCDRQKIEENILNWFGKDSTEDDRKAQVLIATQVVEQSLDLDFDVLITDIAPIDLVIQRAGRLRRHVRDNKGNRLPYKDAKDQRGPAVLYLYTPEPKEDVTADWLKKDHAGTQAVYPHVGQLWLTAKKLLENSGFSMPEDARSLIETVYSGEETYPEALEEASWNAEGEQASKKSLADMNALKLNKGYTYASGDWGEETKIPTRLSEQETVSVALVVEANGKLQPYAGQSAQTWALSTVKIPESEWKKAQQVISDELKPEIEALKTEHKALRWLEVFPLTESTKFYYSSSVGWLLSTGE